jgi:hypothetical protein
MTLIDDLENYKSCTMWLEGFRSKSTKKAYAIHLSLFCKFCSLNPDQLTGIESGQLKTMIFNYIINLKRASKQIAGKPKPGILSVNSIKYYVTGIQSFLEGLERIQYPSLIAAIFGGRSWEARKRTAIRRS